MGSSVAPDVFESDRPSSASGSSGPRPRPRKRLRSVSHSTRAVRAAFEAEHVEGPDLFGIEPAGPPAAEQRRAVGAKFRFDEQLAERRVREIRGRRGQHDLRVAGDLDFPHAVAAIHDRQPPHFHVVFGRDGDLEVRRDAVVHTAERRALRRQRHDVVARLGERGLRRRRPDGPGPNVAQVDELAAPVARHVPPAARDGAAAAEADAAAGVA